MGDFPLVVSYYTQNTLYQLEVQNLIASCEKWNLEHHIEPIASLGSWEKNCAYKPLFLLKKLQEFSRPLFWVDADAVFVRKPKNLEVFEADFAVRINADWDDDHPSKVMSGSVYINATEGAERILKSWAKECFEQLLDPLRAEELWDQVVLRDVLKKSVSGAKIQALPPMYTMIFDNPHDKKNLDEAVICHYQASRRLKKIVNELE